MKKKSQMQSEGVRHFLDTPTVQNNPDVNILCDDTLFIVQNFVKKPPVPPEDILFCGTCWWIASPLNVHEPGTIAAKKQAAATVEFRDIV